MRLQRLLIVTVLAFSFGTMAEAGKPSSGSKKPFFDETRAEFSFPLFEDSTGAVPVLTGDSTGVSIYSDAPGGIAAYFMGSGNPKLELGDPTRHVYLRLDPNEAGCDLPQGETGEFYARGDALWFSQLSTADWGDPDYQTIDGRFLGMEIGDSGYSLLILRFRLDDVATGKEFLWSLVFGNNNDNNPGATRVLVTRQPDTAEGNRSWRVVGQGIADGVSKARVRRGLTKARGKSEPEELGYCSAYIDFDIVQLTQ